MKIGISKIPLEGLRVTEELSPKALDLDTDIVSFSSPVKAEAVLSRITNAITADIKLSAKLRTQCSRCLKEYEVDFNKEFTLNFSTEGMGNFLDLDPDIREEMMLDYPLKPLCKDSCKGLCARCGKNLNEGGCSCGTT
ncbi:MAG TPA: DUF177 domain-containing protein [Candidatus Margulisiibacteriota bacterium]|nr:DUF177 domain-containing protein [Candidatus Margulisiibacteriota bacterium]